jgi:hypothetical protein
VAVGTVLSCRRWGYALLAQPWIDINVVAPNETPRHALGGQALGRAGTSFGMKQLENPGAYQS